MNELVQRLRTLAASLEKNARDLDNAAYVKKAAAFAKTLATFEKNTAEAVSGLAPGLHDLDKILTGPDKRVLKEPVLKKLFQEVLHSKAPAEAKAAALIKQFSKAVKEQGLGEQALAAVQAAVNKARASSEPLPKDKEGQQAELLRLGGLDDEAFAEELDGRYAKDAPLKALAKATGMKPPKAVERSWLIREIRKVASRAASHQIT